MGGRIIRSDGPRHSASPVPSVPAEGSTYPCVSPGNLEPIGTLFLTKPADVGAAVARARRAQRAWAIVPPDERRQRVERFHESLVDHAEEIVDIVARELGRPREEAMVTELSTALVQSNITMDLASEIVGRDPIPTAGASLPRRRSHGTRRPKGVIAVLGSWTSPLSVPLEIAFSALLSGNALVIKPSLRASLTFKKVKELFDATGLPQDLLSVVLGDQEVGEALATSDVDHIVLEGSFTAARAVAALAGSQLTPCTVLVRRGAHGLVLADADLERTAHSLVVGSFVGAGQLHASLQTVEVAPDLHDPLLARIRELSTQLRTGNPDDETVDMGPLVSQERLAAVESFVDRALSREAVLIRGGTRPSTRGYFWEPTVLAACNQEVLQGRTEVLGPVLCIARMGDQEAAVRRLNAMRGLPYVFLFGRPSASAQKLAERIDAHAILFNEVWPWSFSSEVPLGGVRQSGFGHVTGREALLELTLPQFVGTRPPPVESYGNLQYPFSDKAYARIRRALHSSFKRGGLLARLRHLTI